MTSKKNAFIATPTKLLKRESVEDDSDISARSVIGVFKVKSNYQDFKPNYGTNMFGRNKLFQI